MGSVNDLEEWLPVVGYEGLYEVSNLGRVRSYDHYVLRRSGQKVLWRGRVLKPNKGSKGHYRVSLHKDGNQMSREIHRLVARAFIPNPNGYPVVRHWDDDKDNNSVQNLLWGTQQDNIQDALRNGQDYNRQSHKTHCAHGHPYSGDNLYLYPNGYRGCRECKRLFYHKSKKEKTNG